MKDRGPHPALRTILNDTTEVSYSDLDYEIAGRESTTSDSLARLLTIGCLSRLDPDRTSVDIWDPAAGIGYAGFLIADALQSVGVQVKYRGQDINEQAVSACQRRFAEVSDAKVNLGDTLAHDTFPDFEADLVIVDYKDDATAFDGAKKGTIVGKGVINNQMTNHLMRRIEKAGIPTHFVQELSERETLVKKVSIVPLEVIIRNISAGSFAKRYGVAEGKIGRAHV